jgi:hypothetical protein
MGLSKTTLLTLCCLPMIWSEISRADDSGEHEDIADRISGTWVLQQVSSQQSLHRLAPTTIAPALTTPHIRGFCLRVPWHAIDGDFSLLESGLMLARSHNVDYSIRFMAGRHTPKRVLERGCLFYTKKDRQGRDEKIPSVPKPGVMFSYPLSPSRDTRRWQR